MQIQNVCIYKEDGSFARGNLCFEGEIFTANSHGETIDAEGLYAFPGLIDIHLHGCVGYDFCDGTNEAFDAIMQYEAEHGVTAVLPASMTLPEKDLARIFTNAANYSNQTGALFCGIDMEGPFFSPQKKGAQNPDYLRLPDVAMFERLNEAAQGKIKIACVAPELKGGLDFVEEVSRKTKISLAHTASDYDTAMLAFELGATHVTHLYNAMPPCTHRAPGVIGAAADSDCRVEIICDGVHIHPSVVRATMKMFGYDRVVLISDSMMATGMKDGDYSLGGQPVRVKGNLATLEDGTIAGSATNLYDCMKKAVSFGIPLEKALQMATKNPAIEIGEYDRMGSICVGKLANFILADKNFDIQQVYVKGKPIFPSQL